MCLFLDYSSTDKGYVCLLSSGKTYITWNVVFDEIVFSFVLSNNPFISDNNSVESTSSSLIPIFVIKQNFLDKNSVYNRPSSSTLQPIDPSLSSSTTSASTYQIVSSPAPLIPSSVSSPTTTISSYSDNLVSCRCWLEFWPRRKSTIGYIIFLWQKSISRASNK